ncbi:TonB-dependent receptor [Sandarakinorhabdus oryzae]|uniref:TonB-dependent receptor n=1 Tax=Sandarakinorhabdus oryzae TaxID=2675220 RepID=UPI001F42CDCB|nr:TonB-dependent receptor [Sandarakinorhabdus oryzae]
MACASVVALGVAAQPALAQAQTAAAADEGNSEEIIVTGIRASLQKSLSVKRDALGVVDAISAEDIGKFPDTNLAESLQRITGVSIDRQNGEGSKVTVRGFGPDYNLVLLNGRQMPASGLGSCCEAPASRSFDFANLAAESVAGVEVYKSGRATLQTGGIGSVINIKTPRPLDRLGFKGSISVKGMIDHTFEDTKVTPEISGILSKTFADDRVGILVTGVYQRRKASLTQFGAGFREGYQGFENNWGSLPVDANDWRGNYAKTQNRPGANDIYQVVQNAGYDFIDIDRERINGQVVLQVKPTDTLDMTVDYTFSQNTIDARTNSIGVWFNHNNTSSSWTPGPVSGANFYAEDFGPGEGKDLAITGALAANRNINRSIGGNIKWDGPGGLRVELDAHHSTAESKPTSPYGSNSAVGSAIYGVASQKVDFSTKMPVISVAMYPGAEIKASNIRPAGNSFRNGYMKDTINEVSLRGGYDFESDLIKSLDFGVTYTENKVRSAFGVIQNDTWGGTLSAADTPDALYAITPLAANLAGMDGSQSSAIIPSYFQVDTAGLVTLLQSRIGICNASTVQGACLASYGTDRRIREETWAPYIQSTHRFDIGDMRANIRLGLRYEQTRISSSALAPVPTGVVWQAANEMGLIGGNSNSSFTTLKGKYENWLPAFDFDLAPTSSIRLRASYSHTITRPDYTSMQGGITVNQPLRPNGGSTAGSGNPGLLPYKSKNIDLSAEWYYGKDSYISVGFFHKDVSNYIANTTTQGPLFDLPNPAQGAAVQAARTALGGTPGYADILAWLATNNPAVVRFENIEGVNTPTGIIGQASDPKVVFTITQPGNSSQTAKLHGFEFAVQHSFWDTGFGAILNYTIVRSDTRFDNTLRYTATQFAVTGVSDSANAVLYYDKNGIQARVAYNWRDGFLSGYGFDPSYIEPYGQFDVSASWEFKKGFTAFVEGINITNADRRGHMRSDKAVQFAAPGYARYTAGVRYSF